MISAPKQSRPPPTEVAGTQRIRYRRAKLYPKQEAAIFERARYSLIEATTKAGKTAGCLVWLGEQAAMGRPGRNYWWVAPVYPQSKVAFTRMCRSMPQGTFEKNETELRIDLINGTHIWFKSGEKPDNLYGEEVYAAVLDEASRMREESFIAIRSTLTATRGPMRIIGNVKGRRNWFYKMARKAEAGEQGHAYHKITWRDAVAAGILDEAEIDDARRVLPEQAFKQLYEAEPSDDEGNPFGLDKIAACRIEEFSKLPVACWGWDLGKHQDWTVGIALDRNGHMVRFVRFQRSWDETKKQIIAETLGKPALVDATGVGDAIAEELVKKGNFSAFVFTQRSKQELMEGLMSAIQQRKVGLTNETLLNELESFEYEFKGRDGRFTGVVYSAPPGAHDDCVCALALATRHLGGRGYEFRFQRAFGDLAGVAVDGNTPDAALAGNNAEAGEFVRIRRGWEDRGGLV